MTDELFKETEVGKSLSLGSRQRRHVNREVVTCKIREEG
jgi:hypothetical protein